MFKKKKQQPTSDKCATALHWKSQPVSKMVPSATSGRVEQQFEYLGNLQIVR